MINIFRLLHFYYIGISTACVSGNSNICDIGGVPNTSASNLQLNQIIGVVLYIVGGISILMFIISGVMLIMSEGNAQKVATARKTILYTVVGAIISASALTIVDIVLGSVKV